MVDAHFNAFVCHKIALNSPGHDFGEQSAEWGHLRQFRKIWGRFAAGLKNHAGDRDTNKSPTRLNSSILSD